MAKFQWTEFPFLAGGLDLMNPLDQIREGHYPFVQDFRPNSYGFLEPRYAYTSLGTVSSKTPLHTIKALYERYPVSQSLGDITSIFVGVGDSVYYEENMTTYAAASFTPTLVSNGWSGDPVSMVQFKPVQSPESWIYMADTDKMEKSSFTWAAGPTATHRLRTVGITPPLHPPTIARNGPFVTKINYMDSTSGWTAAGAGSTVQLISAAPISAYRVNTTITKILYDTGSAGWCCIEPGSMNEIGEGCFIQNTTQTEYFMVDKAFYGSTQTFLVESVIVDDSGMNGDIVSVTLKDNTNNKSISPEYLAPDALIYHAGANYFRVLSVSIGKNGEKSFRFDRGGTTISVGHSIVIKPSFRTYTGATYANGNTLQMDGLAITHTAPGVNHITQSAALFLANPNANPAWGNARRRQITDEDIFHLSIKITGNAEHRNEIETVRLMLDCDDGTFESNYYVLELTPEEIEKALIHTIDSTTQTQASYSSTGVGILTSQVSSFTRGAGTGTRGGGGSSGSGVTGTGSGAGGGTGSRRHPLGGGRNDDPGTGGGDGGSSGGGTGGRTVPGGGTRRHPIPRPTPVPPSTPITAGNSWSEIEWPRSRFVRVGDDPDKGWESLATSGLRVETKCRGITSRVFLSSFHVRGTYLLDSGDLEIPYYWRYRYRDSSTGARSNWSPPSREPIIVDREDVTVTCTGDTAYTTGTASVTNGVATVTGSGTSFTQQMVNKYIQIAGAGPLYRIKSVASTTSLTLASNYEGTTGSGKSISITSQAGVDKIDIQRFGGALTGWSYLATVDNAASATYLDSNDDLSLAISEQGSNTDYRLWPVLDKPQSGTATTVAGTSMYDSGGGFNVNWAQGTIIHVNGDPYTIYRVQSTTNLETYENMGSDVSSPAWIIHSPVLENQPLPVLIGPYHRTMFGMGDNRNPGRLYLTNTDNPDSTMDTAWIDVTTDTLMNGILYNGSMYIWSTERMYEVRPSLGGVDRFTITEVPSSKGLIARYAFTAGPSIWYMSRDGIYETQGGTPRSITDDKIAVLFNREGRGVTQYTIGAGGNQDVIPFTDFKNAETNSVATWYRLHYHQSYLYFVYPDMSEPNVRANMVYHIPTESWWYDSAAQVVHYGVEGLSNLLLTGDAAANAALSKLGDSASSSAPKIWTPAMDMGNSRADKLFGDLGLDANTGNEALTVEVYEADGKTAVSSTPGTITTTTRGFQRINLASGAGKEATDICMRIYDAAHTSTTLALYKWGASWIQRPEDTDSRTTDAEDLGQMRAKWLQGVRIMADTYNVAKAVNVVGDDETVIASLSLTHNGKQVKAYSWTPVITHLVKLDPTDTDPWKLYDAEWIWEPEPELVLNYVTQETTHDMDGFIHIRDAYISMRSTANVTFGVTVDGTTTNFTVAHTSGNHRRVYVPLGPNLKGKTVSYSLTSAAGFRLYQKDCEVRVKGWGDTGPFRSTNPFGDVSRVQGAAI